MSLRDLLEAAANELQGPVTATEDDASVTWSRAGRAFAAVALDGSRAEFGLDPAVADAAARTPDVAPSPRGPGWVAFAPADLDDRAADRATAWFGSAYRRVEPRN